MQNTRLDKFTIIASSYVVLLIISNLMATKITSFLGMILPAAVLAYPLTFLLGDVLTEVWGLKKARQVIWLGFFLQLLLVVWTNLGIYMSYPDFWKGQNAYTAIFGAVPRIVLGSFAGYILGEIANAWSFDLIKKATQGKYMFARTIGSSVIGQVLDTICFFGIAFYGTMPNNVLIVMMITQYLFKVSLEAVIGTPLSYILVKWVRK